MRLKILLLVIFSIFTGFVMSNKQHEYHLSEGERLVNMILASSAKFIKERFNLRPSGAGAAMPGGPIRQLTLCFETQYPLTKEELREVLIKSSQEFLKQVTENNEIQKFLKEKPFTINNVEILIYNNAKDGRELSDPEISTARISEAKIVYRTIDPQDSFKYKNRFEESYEDALKLMLSK